MQITNTGPGPVTLPNNVELARGASVHVADAEWRDMAKHPVVKHWIDAEELSAVADKKPAADKKAADTGGNPLA